MLGRLQVAKVDAHAARLLQAGVAAAERGATAEPIALFDQMLFFQPTSAKAHEMRAQVCTCPQLCTPSVLIKRTCRAASTPVSIPPLITPHCLSCLQTSL